MLNVKKCVVALKSQAAENPPLFNCHLNHQPIIKDSIVISIKTHNLSLSF